MDPSAPVPIPSTEVSIHKTFGALEIGVQVAIFLFGLLTVQSYTYYNTFNDDRRLFKILVGTVWILELAHTISVAYELYTATITFFGNPHGYSRYPGFGLATLLGGSITMCVQGFFAYRVYSILPVPWKYIGLVCIGLTVGRCVVSFYAGVEAILSTSLLGYAARFKGMLSALFISGAVIDVVIAISMLWFLVEKREQALNRVIRLLDRLVAWTIGTGLLTSIAAVVIAITFMAENDDLIWLAIYVFLAKLYSNSLLSALNARSALRQEAAKSESVTLSRTQRQRDGTIGNSQRPRPPMNPISIEMMTTTQINRDDEADLPVYAVPLGHYTSSKSSMHDSKIREAADSDLSTSPDLEKGYIDKH